MKTNEDIKTELMAVDWSNSIQAMNALVSAIYGVACNSCTRSFEAGHADFTLKFRRKKERKK